jgi:methionine-R-sulfoxide reductase
MQAYSRILSGLIVAAVGISALVAVYGGTAIWRGERTMPNIPPSEGRLPNGAKVSLPMSDEEWRKVLTPEQYEVCRKQGTERPYTGEYWNSKTPGVFKCVCCGNELFTSESKFDSGCGWPSFFEPLSEANIGTSDDRSHFMRRTEVHCNKCGAHLGHVFDDGPHPTGLRYCINSVSLRLDPTASKDAGPSAPKNE